MAGTYSSKLVEMGGTEEYRGRENKEASANHGFRTPKSAKQDYIYKSSLSPRLGWFKS